MPTKFYLGGKKIVRPGVYSRIVSGRQNPPLNLDYGTVLIIDNDTHLTLSGGIRGGAGVNGTNASGKDAIYEIRTLADLQEFVGAGWWYKAAEFLFRPNGSDPGVSKVYVIKPATTTPATMTFATSTGGTFKFMTRDESLAANGDLDTDDELISGYAYTVEAGVNDPAKWIMKVWRGTYKGAYTDLISYDELTEAVAVDRPDLIIQSPEFDNVQTLIDWATTNTTFGSYFILDSTSAVVGTGVVLQTDVTAVDGYNVAAGGTETYDSIDDALEAVQDLDYNFVVTTYSDPEGVSGDSSVLKIVDHILNEARFDKFLFLYGHDDDITKTIAEAEAFNNDRVHIVHSAIKKASRAVASGLRIWDSFFHMNYMLGRLCGLPPQVPLTFKALGIDGLVHNPTLTEQEIALENGVLVTYFDNDRGEYTVLQGINTLQNNDFTLNPDGTSFSIQIRRIAAQLNKELVVNAKIQLLSDPLGVNRSTLSEKDLQEWVKGYLSRRLATDTQDNLILSYRNVAVTREDDNYLCTYEFEPNGEITKLFLTGFML